jgi:hypothetical protein
MNASGDEVNDLVRRAIKEWPRHADAPALECGDIRERIVGPQAGQGGCTPNANAVKLDFAITMAMWIKLVLSPPLQRLSPQHVGVWLSEMGGESSGFV